MRCRETFSFMMSLPTMSLGDRMGQGEVGGVQTAWLCLGSAVERSWLALGGSFLSFLETSCFTL